MIIPMFIMGAISQLVWNPTSAEPDRDKRMFNLNPFTAAMDMASNAADSVLGTVGLEKLNPIKLSGQAVGGVLGGAGLLWGKQENKKCYYYWGLGFSGPDSVNPERWNGEKWDQEDTGGLLHAAGNLAGLGMGVLLDNVATDEVRVQGCKMLGMGYKTQQPGYPSKPGTCPQGPDCNGQPGKTTVVIQRNPGYDVTTTYQGNPPQYQVIQGNPVYDVPTTQQGNNPPQYQVIQGRPGYEVTTINQGKPPQYQVTPGKPGYEVTTTYQGNPPQYQVIQDPRYTTVTTSQQQPMCPCACQG